MQLEIEVWLRGSDFATTFAVDAAIPDPAGWTLVPIVSGK